MVETSGSCYPEGEVTDQGLRPGAQHEAVMDALFVAAQVESFIGSLGDDEAEQVDVEGSRPIEVGDHVLRVGRPQHVERRCGPLLVEH